MSTSTPPGSQEYMVAEVEDLVELPDPSEWTPAGGRHEAPPARVEADRVELGELAANHLDYQRGNWWDMGECA